MHVIVDCSVADPGEAPEGPAPLIFRPNWGPKGRKNVFWRPRPSPSIKGSGLPAPLPFWATHVKWKWALFPFLKYY